MEKKIVAYKHQVNLKSQNNFLSYRMFLDLPVENEELGLC